MRDRLIDRGHGDDADLRRFTVDGLVDTRAVTLVLPKNVVERLGPEQQGTASVTCSDERREESPLAGPVTVRIGNPSMRMDMWVGMWTDRGTGVAAVFLRPSRSIRCSRACD